jgi:hypothetical integral membrane protein (TIGR02206 family)
MILLSKHTIPFLSSEWLIANGITFFLIIILILLLIRSRSEFVDRFNKYFAFFLIAEYLFFQFYSIFNGTWTVIESMPFHLCTLMWFNTIYILFTRKQWAFELMLFIGMPGAAHALLTPQLNFGNEFVYMFDFFFSHGWLFICPFYCIFVLGMKPRLMSWWHSFLRLQDIIALVFLANFSINYFSFGYILPPSIDSPTANFMYLLALPLADNPFVVGSWPSYLLILLFAVFIHALIVYLPFKLTNYLLKNR